MGYDYYGSGANDLGRAFAPSMGGFIWTIIALVIAVAGCFLVYFLFVNKDTKLENKFLAWLRSFLRFDKMLIETILKIAYIFAAIAITLMPFGLMNFLAALLTVVFGNLVLRIVYELSMIRIMIWKNTTEIKKHLK